MSFTKEDQDRFAVISTFEEFRSSVNFQLYKTIRTTRLGLYTHRYNYNELRKAISRFHSNVDLTSFWSNASPYFRWNTQKKITTHVFNYLNSGSAFADISRINSRQHLNEEMLESYGKHITKTFVETPDLAFVRNLRNYISHYSLLNIGVHSHWNHITGKSNMIYLSKSRLLEWSGWSAPSFQYLKSQNERIDFEPTIVKYHDQYMLTQNLLLLGIVEKYSRELSQLTSSMEQILEDGIRHNVSDFIPFRSSTLRYIKCLLKTSQNHL